MYNCPGLLVNVDKLEETIWNVFNEEEQENEHSDDNQSTERCECGIENECISSKKGISCRKMEESDGRKRYQRYRRYTEEDMQRALSYMEETG